ncbi:hypothetical protein PIB30_042873 [Stylosanthes scabra]|uniref:Uncharacterized protein n=1 Tax=Stylosanthes scabra TaxID=79078 RepID=A0ABU6ZE31_9FABA|nr:hypothetical protein [Stylosanthes scabra]
MTAPGARPSVSPTRSQPPDTLMTAPWSRFTDARSKCHRHDNRRTEDSGGRSTTRRDTLQEWTRPQQRVEEMSRKNNGSSLEGWQSIREEGRTSSFSNGPSLPLCNVEN